MKKAEEEKMKLSLAQKLVEIEDKEDEKKEDDGKQKKPEEKELDIPHKKSKEHLKYTFTEEEKMKLSYSLAQKLVEIEDKEDEKKALQAQLKAEIDSIQAEINSTARKVRDGYEFRQIDCNWVPDTGLKIWNIYRTDTFELVRTKRMTDDDRQLRF